MPHDMNAHASDEFGNGDARNDWRVRYRLLVTLAAYALIFTASLFGAFALAYNFHRFGKWFWALFMPLALLAIPIKLVIFVSLKKHLRKCLYHLSRTTPNE